MGGERFRQALLETDQARSLKPTANAIRAKSLLGIPCGHAACRRRLASSACAGSRPLGSSSGPSPSWRRRRWAIRSSPSCASSSSGRRSRSCATSSPGCAISRASYGASPSPATSIHHPGAQQGRWALPGLRPRDARDRSRHPLLHQQGGPGGRQVDHRDLSGRRVTPEKRETTSLLGIPRGHAHRRRGVVCQLEFRVRADSCPPHGYPGMAGLDVNRSLKIVTVCLAVGGFLPLLGSSNHSACLPAPHFSSTISGSAQLLSK
jgi:hypothetical protein